MQHGTPPKGKIALIATVAVMVALVALCVHLSLERSRDGIVDRYDERTSSLTEFAATTLGQWRASRSVAAKATFAGDVTREDVAGYLRAVKPRVEWAAVVGSRGVVAASRRAGAADEPNFVDRPSIRRALAGRVAIGGVVRGARGPLMLIATPLPGDGRGRVLVDAIPADSLEAILAPYLESTTGETGATAEIVDPYGNVVASSAGAALGTPASTEAGRRAAAQGAQPSGSFENGGVPSHYSSAPIDGTTLKLIRTTSEDSLFESQKGTTKLAWALFAAFALAFCALLAILVRALERSKRKIAEQSEAALRRAYEHDGLTGLPGRKLLLDSMDSELAATAGRGVGVISIHLVRHHRIRNRYGRAAGDRVIAEVSERLGSLLRGADTLARIEEDGFAVLCTSVRSEEELGVLATRLQTATVEPCPTGAGEAKVTARMGVASSEWPISAEELLRRADTALSAAIAEGRPFEVYREGMGHVASERFDLEADLVDAIHDEELTVVFQPIVSLADGRIRSCEALVRWEHPERGLLGPDEFIPIAEETGLISDIGQEVLRIACRQGAEWLDAGTPVNVNVNVSPHQLTDSLPMAVALALDESGFEPQRLCLELTESAFAEDEEMVESILRALHKLRVRIAIDDFGTGYSSWSRIAGGLPVDVLKIDRTFTSGLTDHADAAVLASIIQLGAALELEIVAEGVETKAEESALRSLECPYAQGYLFGRPVPARELDLPRALSPSARTPGSQPPSPGRSPRSTGSGSRARSAPA